MRLTKGSTLLVAFVAPMMFAPLSASSLGAQHASGVTIDGLSTGSRVRVATNDALVFAGTLLRVNVDSLVVQPPGGLPVAVPRARLTRLEVRRGVQSHGSLGAGLGLLAGVAVGGVVAEASRPKKSDCGGSAVGEALCTPLNIAAASTSTTTNVIGFGLLGALVGAMIGHAGHETWLPVPVTRAGDARARVTVQQVAQQTGIGVALQF